MHDQEQYRFLFDNMAAGAYFQDRDGMLTDANSAALDLFDLTREQFIGCHAGNLERTLFAEDGNQIPLDQHPAMIAQRTGESVSNFIAGLYLPRRKSRIWLNISATPVCLKDQQTPNQVIVTLHDITYQKQISDIHASRLHLMRFAESHTLRELFVETLDDLERLTGSTIGFYHFYDAASQAISLQEWSTRTKAELCNTEGNEEHYNLCQAGVWADCLRQEQPVIHNDYASLQHRRGLPEGHAPIIRELVVPVKRQNRIVAILGVGNKPVDYTEEDITTVSLFADLAWDIAEKKQAESRLKQATYHYEILTNTSRDGFWVTDDSGHILAANKTICQMYGYRAEELPGKSLRDFDALEDREQMSSHIENIRQRGYERFETRHFTKDGKLLDVEVSTAYIPENKTYMGFVRDISERKRNNEALRASEERFRSLFENIPDAVFLTIPDGKIIAANPAACSMLGYTEEELQSLDRSDLLDINDPRLAKGLTMRERYGRVQGWKLSAIRKNGEKFPVEVDSVILPGSTLQSFVIMRDITEVIRRDERDRQIQKMEAIGRLTGGVAHDFNNLLTPIIGISELLLHNLDPGDSRRESVEAILRAGFRAADLVNQLLAFSRQQTLSIKPVDINQIVANFKRLLRRTIPENIAIEFIPASNIDMVLAEHGQIEQVILNLAVNASDAMPDGGKLTIETSRRKIREGDTPKDPFLKPGSYILLTVSDTGYGIDVETGKHLFEPFFSTKGKHGTGLGLATVYGIVKQHNGFIRVDSAPGKGCRFEIFFPIAGLPHGTDKPDLVTATRAAGTETILLVEDDAEVLQLVRTVLEEQGYTVIAAQTGSEALAALKSQQEKVHLLLTDVILPVMNGKEIYLEAVKDHPDLKVLYMSGYTDDIIAHHGVLDEGVDYIKKPFSCDALAIRVREVLELENPRESG